MWFEDLSIYEYLDEAQTKPLIAIGWLENGKSYNTGVIEKQVLEKLGEFQKNPRLFVVAAGVHECDFCFQKAGVINLTIPRNGTIYFCPELIMHYIENHSYLPPKEFCEAVLNCPPMQSLEYRQKLLENGGEDLQEFFDY